MLSIIQPFFSVPSIENRLYTSSFKQAQTLLYYVCEIKSELQHTLGLIATVPLAALGCNRLLIHENIFPKKTRQFQHSFKKRGIQDNPVLLTYKTNAAIEQLLSSLVTKKRADTSFYMQNNQEYKLWFINDQDMIAAITRIYNQTNQFYIADGHHRIASLQQYYGENKEINQPKNILAYLVSDHHILLRGFNKLLYDLGSFSEHQFMQKLSAVFLIIPVERHQQLSTEKPGMYLSGKWHILELKEKVIKPDRNSTSPAFLLDFFIFDSILGIKNEFFENKIVSVSHSVSLDMLESDIKKGVYKAAFYLPPLSMDDFFSYAQNKKLLPPNTTCFEPKMSNGLISLDIRENSKNSVSIRIGHDPKPNL